ncbi:maleylacetate reductase [Aquipuribacter sp. SD81]|uniref:maleylacetate reductase n=1 Tax=Aquipuribacter sp. SD81 TaxID=3127703 RepID=UPI00301690EB
MSASFTHTALGQRVVFGVGAARADLAAEVDRLGATRVLLVAGQAELDLARGLAGPLGDRVVATADDVRRHVPVECAEAARAAAREHRADLVLSVGGGSTTGTAKAVALTERLPVLAVPTTYAGSEMTNVWGLTDAGRKTTGVDDAVAPRTVVYDPELTVGLPPALSAASALNAMAHCVEAVWAPGANPVTDLVAYEGVAALRRGLPGVLADGADLAARSDVLLGAWLSGSAFAQAGSGLHHKTCHVLGGAYDLPHAELHAVVLPHVLAFQLPALGARAERLRAALDPGGSSPDAAAALAGLEDDLGVPAGLRDIGLAEADVAEAAALVADVVADRRIPNPRPVARADVAALVRAAWAGRPGTPPTGGAG